MPSLSLSGCGLAAHRQAAHPICCLQRESTTRSICTHAVVSQRPLSFTLSLSAFLATTQWRSSSFALQSIVKTSLQATLRTLWGRTVTSVAATTPWKLLMPFFSCADCGSPSFFMRTSSASGWLSILGVASHLVYWPGCNCLRTSI